MDERERERGGLSLQEKMMGWLIRLPASKDWSNSLPTKFTSKFCFCDKSFLFLFFSQYFIATFCTLKKEKKNEDGTYASKLLHIRI